MKKRIIHLLIAYTVLFLFAVIYLPIYKYTGMGLPCLFNLITGYLCPGCGITRMFLSILQFDLHSAFSYNKLIFILLPLFLFYTIKFSKDYIICEKMKISKKDNIVFYTVSIILVVFGILRNII